MKKIWLILFGLILGLGIIEIILRLCGFGYNVVCNAYDKPVYNDSYRIFCIGESTTWGVGTGDPITESYPEQLKCLLKKEAFNKNIQCFYDRNIGQNTSEILLKLPKYIKK